MSDFLSGNDDRDDSAYYQSQLQEAHQEISHLQERVSDLERDNALLKRTVFELSTLPCTCASSDTLALDVLGLVRSLTRELPRPASAVALGKGSAARRAAPAARAAARSRVPTAEVRFGGNFAVNNARPPFVMRADLTGHTGAVYTVQFAPCGRLLGSASYDRSVCIWDLGTHLDRSVCEARTTLADAHRAQVVALEWASDSRHLVTGGYDQYASHWDVESAAALARFPCLGLVNAVSVSPADDALFFAATSNRVVHAFDRRIAPRSDRSQDDPTIALRNSHVINTVHVQLDGVRVQTGDSGGAVKTWDMRMLGASFNVDSNEKQPRGLVHTVLNEPNGRPITHIHDSPPVGADGQGRFTAVNSYDDYLRVYDRESLLRPSGANEAKLIHSLSGATNKNMPIKSSFFLGANYRPPRARTRRRSRGSSVRDDSSVDLEMDESRSQGGEISSEEERGDGDTSSSESESDDGVNQGESNEQVPRSQWVSRSIIESKMILATGSADECVYVYDIGGRAGSGKVLQKLDEHSDRVYSVDFHPSEPILASCSGDHGIKIWVDSAGVTLDPSRIYGLDGN